MENNRRYKQLIEHPKPRSREYITVQTLYEEVKDRLPLRIINKRYSFDRKITQKELNRPGLALSGFVEVFTYWRVQVMGNPEIGYVNSLQGRSRRKAIHRLLAFELPCIIVTNDNLIPEELVEIANKNGITIFSTPLNTTATHRHLSEYLDGKFARYIVIHGTLVDVYSVGVMFVGPASIGKSELALDLIERGHQLVADDAVEITKTGLNTLQGAPCGRIGHHMEIRGLGIIDVYKMFGVRGIRGKKDIHVIVKLAKFSKGESYERTGLDEIFTKIMGVDLPLVELPVMEGKNLTIVAEAIALDQKLKQIGVYQAREFNEGLISQNLQQSGDLIPEVLVDDEDLS